MVFIEVFENYVKQTYRNRCIIAGANSCLGLSVPVIKESGSKTQIKDVSISYQEDWQKRHWRAIESAYNNSPYFLYYKDQFLPFYNNRFVNLLEYNFLLIDKILFLMGIERRILTTPEYSAHYEDAIDLRYTLSPKKSKHGVDKEMRFPPYTQVFSKKHGFIPNLSIIDLLFNVGPEAFDYLKCCEIID